MVALRADLDEFVRVDDPRRLPPSKSTTLVDRQGQPKPAFEGMIEALK